MRLPRDVGSAADAELGASSTLGLRRPRPPRSRRCDRRVSFPRERSQALGGCRCRCAAASSTVRGAHGLPSALAATKADGGKAAAAAASFIASKGLLEEQTRLATARAAAQAAAQAEEVGRAVTKAIADAKAHAKAEAEAKAEAQAQAQAEAQAEADAEKEAAARAHAAPVAPPSLQHPNLTVAAPHLAHPSSAYQMPPPSHPMHGYLGYPPIAWLPTASGALSPATSTRPPRRRLCSVRWLPSSIHRRVSSTAAAAAVICMGLGPWPVHVLMHAPPVPTYAHPPHPAAPYYPYHNAPQPQQQPLPPQQQPLPPQQQPLPPQQQPLPPQPPAPPRPPPQAPAELPLEIAAASLQPREAWAVEEEGELATSLEAVSADGALSESSHAASDVPAIARRLELGADDHGVAQEARPWAADDQQGVAQEARPGSGRPAGCAR